MSMPSWTRLAMGAVTSSVNTQSCVSFLPGYMASASSRELAGGGGGRRPWLIPNTGARAPLSFRYKQAVGQESLSPLAPRARAERHRWLPRGSAALSFRLLLQWAAPTSPARPPCRLGVSPTHQHSTRLSPRTSDPAPESPSLVMPRAGLVPGAGEEPLLPPWLRVKVAWAPVSLLPRSRPGLQLCLRLPVSTDTRPRRFLWPSYVDTVFRGTVRVL